MQKNFWPWTISTIWTLKAATYYDELKEELDQQAQLNKSEFDSLDDETRIQYEGYRPGMYVRMEVRIPLFKEKLFLVTFLFYV